MKRLALSIRSLFAVSAQAESRPCERKCSRDWIPMAQVEDAVRRRDGDGDGECA